MRNFTQTWEHRWPSEADKPVGRLLDPATTLAERFDLRFKHDIDDLDRYSYVGLGLPSGRVVQLVQYENYPDYGTLIFADSLDDSDQAREEIMAALDLRPDEIIVET